MNSTPVRTGIWPWFFGALMLAALVHLLSVLLVPQFATRDAFVRLASGIAPYQVKIISNGAGPLQPLPSSDPDMVVGICRYDLRDGPLRVIVPVEGDEFLSVSFHERRGKVFYAMTDQAAVRRQINLVLGTTAQIDDLESGDDEDEPSKELRIPTVSEKGFVVFRALAEQRGDEAEARARITAARCLTNKQSAN